MPLVLDTKMSGVVSSFGVSMDSDKSGVKLKTVLRGGAAEKAGLKVGDVLVSIGGEKVANVMAAGSKMANLTIGQDVKFLVRRAGQEKMIVVKDG